MIVVTGTGLEWYDILGRLALAAFLGALVGVERESSGQDAGFRTHLLLALGAALFGIISVGAFDQFITDDPTNVRFDPTRLASYVVAGVGFIGGGVIIKHAGTVRGITTAASLWAAAAIGLAAGVGFWIGAVSTVIIAIVALAGLRPLSNWILRVGRQPRSLVIVARTGAAADVLHRVHEVATSSVRSMQVGEGSDVGMTELRVQFWTRPDEQLVERIIHLVTADFDNDVLSISLNP